MRQRRETVEHPFGTIKARMGATHFLMKTLPRVATEMALHAPQSYTSHNIMGPGGLIGQCGHRSPKLETTSTGHHDARNGTAERQARSETAKQPKLAEWTRQAATQEAAGSQASATALPHAQGPERPSASSIGLSDVTEPDGRNEPLKT